MSSQNAKRIIASTVLIYSFTFCTAQRKTDAAAIDSLVNAAVTSYFADSVHVGLSIGVAYLDNRYLYNYGKADKTMPAPPTSNSLYEIGSLTKTFTGILLAKAINEKRIKIDDDIRLYLKGKYPNLEYKGQPITVRHLVTHRSGLPNSIPDNSELFKSPDFDKLPYQLIAAEKDYNKKRYLKELHNIKLDTLPGAVFFKYSNIGIKLMSFMLENVYNKTYDQLVKENIFEPLKMHDTKLALRKQDSARLVEGYGPSGKQMPYTLENAGAAGGFKSTLNDMIRYAAWHMSEKDSLVTTSHQVLDGALADYARGMGWNMANTKEGYRKLWQSGGTFGMSSQLIMFPDLHIAFILIANDAGFNTQSQLEKIALSVVETMFPH